jgi:hypothetical protein
MQMMRRFGRAQGVAVKPTPSLRLTALGVRYVWNGGAGAVWGLGELALENWSFYPFGGR